LTDWPSIPHHALYLLHPFVFLLVKAVLSNVTVPQLFCWPLVFATVALAIVAADLFHRFVEVPVVAYLRKATARRIAAPADSGG
jgi:exopolysaccharide production protein ExoZ